jgi:hypothetical protein
VAFDRDQDWEKRKEKLKKETIKKRAKELGAMKREAVSAAFVTGDAHWDLLLSIITAKIKKLRGQVEEARERLESSDEFSPDAMINQKLGVRLLGVRIDELEWLVTLPSILKEQGDQAAKLLESIEETTD